VTTPLGPRAHSRSERHNQCARRATARRRPDRRSSGPSGPSWRQLPLTSLSADDPPTMGQRSPTTRRRPSITASSCAWRLVYPDQFRQFAATSAIGERLQQQTLGRVRHVCIEPCGSHSEIAVVLDQQYADRGRIHDATMSHEATKRTATEVRRIREICRRGTDAASNRRVRNHRRQTPFEGWMSAPANSASSNFSAVAVSLPLTEWTCSRVMDESGLQCCRLAVPSVDDDIQPKRSPIRLCLSGYRRDCQIT
jgi:hypothetical protein